MAFYTPLPLPVEYTDPTYADQQAELRKAYAQFLARQGLDRSNYMGNFALQARDIDNANARTSRDLKDDFAGRRLLHSGLFARADSEVNDDFNSRRAQMENDRAAFESGLNSSLADFQGNQEDVLLKAKQEAIARRAIQPGQGQFKPISF